MTNEHSARPQRCATLCLLIKFFSWTTILTMTIDEQIAYLNKGTVEIIRVEELRAKLEQSARSGKPLRVKLCADTTAPDIHLGHTVMIRKLRDLQTPGHTVIFLI